MENSKRDYKFNANVPTNADVLENGEISVTAGADGKRSLDCDRHR